MKVKVDYTIKAVQRKGANARYDLVVILLNKDADQKVYGKNFSNIEVVPAKALDMGDYQLICNERGLGELMQNSKGFRITDAEAEVGIGTYAETGDKYYFVKVQLSESVKRTCYLSQSQIKNLKYVNLGFEFEETTEVISSKSNTTDIVPIVEE